MPDSTMNRHSALFYPRSIDFLFPPLDNLTTSARNGGGKSIVPILKTFSQENSEHLARIGYVG